MDPIDSETHVLRAGLDIGSTTAKLLVLGRAGQPCFTACRRHGTDVTATLAALLTEAALQLNNAMVCMTATGSAGMGVAETVGLPFIQEVISAGEVVRRHFPEVRTLIDIGGEDGKMMFLKAGAPPDIRMNGSCAGGTGAFIDQMAALLDISLETLDRLASRYRQLHPIASRCGVFAKTDLQNLISRRAELTDICASILNAVVLQNLATLARGRQVRPPVLLCGGPLSYLSSLRRLLRKALGLEKTDTLLPAASLFLPAWGAALAAAEQNPALPLKRWQQRLAQREASLAGANRLPPLFENDEAFRKWERQRVMLDLPHVALAAARLPLSLGIDSGSTTTKVLALDTEGRIAFADYCPNRGNPVAAVAGALRRLDCSLAGRHPEPFAGAVVTGYGEDLIRAAFDLEAGVVETMAHWRAAARCDPQVSFLLDIGGQDMKAVFLGAAGIRRIEINEACSSGCGTFIETFAGALGMDASAFAEQACRSRSPCDLGTRCTVFMNSGIKQAQRENAAIEDIAAGLAYAVVKNSLYKVLKLRDVRQLGDHIVVQGGTFRNPAVIRALEVLTGKTVASSGFPEMMGAYGAALMAQQRWVDGSGGHRMRLKLPKGDPNTGRTRCGGCTHRCRVTVFTFGSGRKFYLGNRCERVFSNHRRGGSSGTNLMSAKNRLLFERDAKSDAQRGALRIGIPRILGMFEAFPFWHRLFTEAGLQVVLSPPSSQKLYEKGLPTVMSDNICFPAKLAHGHVRALLDAGVDRLFYPHVLCEPREDTKAANSFNCPIVSAYGEVLQGMVEDIPFDSPAILFSDEPLLKKACRHHLHRLGVTTARSRRAFQRAMVEQAAFRRELHRMGKTLVGKARSRSRLLVVLAARPYHADPLVEHSISTMLAGLDVDILPVEAAAAMAAGDLSERVAVSQWSFTNRLLKAARWVADQESPQIQLVMLTSFGCGPDAFVVDEVSEVLEAAGKIFTLIKMDDIASTGSAMLRLRSLIETVRRHRPRRQNLPTLRSTTPPYSRDDRGKTIIAPHFGDCYAPFFVPVFREQGHHMEILPPADRCSVDYGMRYTHNEVCYPAILVVGDIIKAFKSGRYDPRCTVAAMTQTGGQCRATSYVSLIRRALTAAGYGMVPVVAITAGGDQINEQPGFALDTTRLVRSAFVRILYADAIARLYYRSAPRQYSAGKALALRNHFLGTGGAVCGERDPGALLALLAEAVTAYNKIVRADCPLPRVGLVGEIFLKHNTFSHMQIVDWMMASGVEVVIPPLIDFVMQFFVNARANRRLYLAQKGLSVLMERWYEHAARKWIGRFERVLSRFYLYEPSTSIWNKAASASGLVSLANQYGEGWLIPAEMADFSRRGIFNIVCVQPFGCIANQVVAKGIEHRVRRHCPSTSLLFLDFDASTSEVNALNRLHFMIRNAREGIAAARCA
jgi:predicted CoA-substrate-specific enzyme activase